jgi:hypothetical protein
MSLTRGYLGEQTLAARGGSFTPPSPPPLPPTLAAVAAAPLRSKGGDWEVAWRWDLVWWRCFCEHGVAAVEHGACANAAASGGMPRLVVVCRGGSPNC